MIDLGRGENFGESGQRSETFQADREILNGRSSFSQFSLSEGHGRSFVLKDSVIGNRFASSVQPISSGFDRSASLKNSRDFLPSIDYIQSSIVISSDFLGSLFTYQLPIFWDHCQLQDRRGFLLQNIIRSRSSGRDHRPFRSQRGFLILRIRS
jgi:hypothetical protein